MNKEKEQAELHTSEKTSIGFDYQYYFFLWKLLELKKGSSIGLEVEDDVYIRFSNDSQIYYQLKHSLQRKASGETINLTKFDKDFWQTLATWSKIITDTNSGRGKHGAQKEFVQRTKFILASNKSESSNNAALENISSLQSGHITIQEFLRVFNELIGETSNSEIKENIKVITLMEMDVLEAFILNVQFQLNQDDLVGKCKDAVLEKMVPESKVHEVYQLLDSAIREHNFIEIKKGKKLLITFDDFHKRFRRYFDRARNERFVIRDLSYELPDDLYSQIFIKQLLEIEDIGKSDIEEVTRLTIQKLKLQNNISKWICEGELTREEASELKKEAFEQWRNKYKSKHRGIQSDDKINEAALQILDSMRDRRIDLSGQTLDTDLSNGTFYELSDKPSIGWRNDWEKYK